MMITPGSSRGPGRRYFLTAAAVAVVSGLALMVAACHRPYTAVYFITQVAQDGLGSGYALFRMPAGGGSPTPVLGSHPMAVRSMVIQREPAVLYAGYAGHIVRMTLTGEDYKVIAPAPSPHTLAIDAVRGRLYWGDITGHEVRRCNLDGSGLIDVVRDVRYPLAVAIDEVHDTFFWSCDGPIRGVWRANGDGSDPTYIAKTAFVSTAMAVDGRAKRLFWFDQVFRPGPSRIVSTDPWGKDLRVVVNGLPDYVEGLALDPAARLVYWIERHPAHAKPAKIRRVRYDGTSPQTLYEFPAGEHFARALALGDTPRREE